MIVVKIVMWPKGVEAREYPLGEVRIANIGGDEKTGSYKVELWKSQRKGARPRLFRSGLVMNFPRLRLNAFDLLLRGLAACVGSRNIEADCVANRTTDLTTPGSVVPGDLP